MSIINNTAEYCYLAPVYGNKHHFRSSALAKKPHPPYPLPRYPSSPASLSSSTNHLAFPPPKLIQSETRRVCVDNHVGPTLALV